jgi:hypothetical protein
LASQTGKRIPELLALARSNDPFFAGSDAQKRDAQWFLEVWNRFGFGSGIHLRRIHYRIISDKELTLMPNGMAYRNTHESWVYLDNASKAARYLRLVDPAAFVDRRNPDPQIYAMSREKPVPACEIDPPDWALPSVSIELEARLDLPMPMVDGYDYELADQRFHLAIWIEKSTMDDVLAPLCRRYGVDLVTGVGFQSITSVITMLRQRVAKHGKPTRIWYISDFDPAGEHMPVATARQIEFWLNEYAPGIDIKLSSLALTKEQVIRYRLPRIPIKETDLRKKGFEDRHGEGAVELDALEALHPGELGRIVRDAVKPYFDDELWERLREADNEAADYAEAEWEAITQNEAEQLEQLRAEADVIGRKYSKRVVKLKQDFDAALEPLNERLEVIRHAIQEKIAEFQVELPKRPEAAESDANESEWLYDSSRPYLEQIDSYRRHKGAADEEG